jgi:hypothetical protein
MATKVTPSNYAIVKSFADRGDKLASTMVDMFNQTYFADISAGVEATNVIIVSGQVRDQDGTPRAAVVDVVVESTPVSGAGTMTVSTGTAKKGSGTTKVWLQTDATGAFAVNVTNAAAEDNLIEVRVDNGESEFLKLTYT